MSNFSNSDSTFSHELAIQLLQDCNEFPVDFDQAWQWLGYATKQNALKTLKNNFEEGVDFLCSGIKSSGGGRPRECISLSIDCFKALGMASGTEKGKEIRKYFLNCEKELKRVKQGDPVKPLPSDIPTPDMIINVVTMTLKIAEIDPKMIAASAVNHVANYYPGMRALAENLKKELVIEVEENLLTPTQIGEILFQKTGIKHSAIKVNKMLTEKGLQQPNPDGKEPAYLPLGQGCEFAKIILQAQKGEKDATRQSLRWYPSVIDFLTSN